MVEPRVLYHGATDLFRDAIRCSDEDLQAVFAEAMRCRESERRRHGEPSHEDIDR